MNRKVEAYWLIRGVTANDLSCEVERMLEKGYELYGSPVSAGGLSLCQAVVKYAWSDPDDPDHTDCR